MIELWREAVEKYQHTAGIDFSSEGVRRFDSKRDIIDYLREQEARFRKFRADGPQRLRDRAIPVVTILQQLCDPVGESLSDVCSDFEGAWATY